MMSYDCDMTRPDDKEYEFIARFDPNKRTGGFGSEEYALFHGWEVGLHAADSELTGQKCVLRTNPVPFPDSLNVEPERGGWI